MNILFDTSVIFPAFRYPHLDEKLLGLVLGTGHHPVLTDYVLDEFRQNVRTRYDGEQKAICLDLVLEILSKCRLKVLCTDDYAQNFDRASELVIEKDAPVLAAAMLPEIDYLVTRDKRDFLNNDLLMSTEWAEKIIAHDQLNKLL